MTVTVPAAPAASAIRRLGARATLVVVAPAPAVDATSAAAPSAQGNVVRLIPGWTRQPIAADFDRRPLPTPAA